MIGLDKTLFGLVSVQKMKKSRAQVFPKKFSTPSHRKNFILSFYHFIYKVHVVTWGKKNGYGERNVVTFNLNPKL